MKHCSTILGFLFYLFSAIGFSSGVEAHGGVIELKDDKCAKFVGGNIVHFNVYQPLHDKHANYCSVIPHTGEAILVVDLVNQKLRETPVSIKLVARSEDGVEKAIHELPPKIYQRGVIEMAAVFEKAGYYLAYVTIEGLTAKQPVMGYRVALRPQVGAPPIQFMLGVFVLAAFGIILALSFGPKIKRAFGKN